MNVGILGAGHIAESIAATIVKMDDRVNLYAVSSRSLEKAQDFASRFGITKAYGSYKEMLADEKVDLVYIATPHSHHYEQMKLCAEYNKNVLCEKAFTMNAKQAEEVIKLFDSKNLYLAEAIWTRYMPSRKIIDAVISSNIVGKPCTLTANLSYTMTTKERLIKPELAGGALLDVGIYTLNFAFMHFGKEIERIESSVKLTESGVDGFESMTLFYKDGKTASLTSSLYSRSDRKGYIWCQGGYIEIENINNPSEIKVYDFNDKLIESHKVPEQISGYEYQFYEAEEKIRSGKKESSSMPLSETLFVMQQMDELRKKWGVVYPQEK